jgi:hypothetical protein
MGFLYSKVFAFSMWNNFRVKSFFFLTHIFLLTSMWQPYYCYVGNECMYIFYSGYVKCKKMLSIRLEEKALRLDCFSLPIRPFYPSEERNNSGQPAPLSRYVFGGSDAVSLCHSVCAIGNDEYTSIWLNSLLSLHKLSISFGYHP